ncbi:MAG: hypothetical protein ABFD03_03090 [Clostridiaceae bacterium]
MDENDVHILICMENAAPKPRVIRSAGALYVILLLLVVGVIAAANALNERLNIPRGYVQIALYAALLLAGWYVYRFRLTAFRYTLTDRVFAIDRIVGQREWAEECAELINIMDITAASNLSGRSSARKNCSILPARKSSAIFIQDGTERRVLIVSPSEEFLEKLTMQWQTVKSQLND